MMKRKLLILSVLVICFATLTTGTLAYFTSKGTVHNVITTGGVEIEIREWADEEKTQEFVDISGVLPDTSVTKIVEIWNTGSAAAFVRARIEIVVTDAEGRIFPLAGYADLITLDINTVSWTKGEDGYYYFNRSLPVGKPAEALFHTVTFAPAMGNDYQNATVKVNVYAQAVQTANNGTDPLTARGWPAE